MKQLKNKVRPIIKCQDGDSDSKEYLSGQRRAPLGSWWLLETAPIAAVKDHFKEELCLEQQEAPKD